MLESSHRSHQRTLLTPWAVIFFCGSGDSFGLKRHFGGLSRRIASEFSTRIWVGEEASPQVRCRRGASGSTAAMEFKHRRRRRADGVPRSPSGRQAPVVARLGIKFFTIALGTFLVQPVSGSNAACRTADAMISGIGQYLKDWDSQLAYFSQFGLLFVFLHY